MTDTNAETADTPIEVRASAVPTQAATGARDLLLLVAAFSRQTRRSGSATAARCNMSDEIDGIIAKLTPLEEERLTGWDRKPANLRVFGYASKDGPLKNWRKACKDASIPYLPPHSAGRHGFGQEMKVRQKLDTKAVEAGGGWSASGHMVDRTYTHAEDASGKIIRALRTGRVQAEKRASLKLAEKVRK